MKKLLAILLVAMLAVPMFAGTDILNFMWFNNKIGVAFSDRTNLPSQGYDDQGTGVNANSVSTGNGMNYYNIIEQFMCGMWGTAYEGNGVALKMDFFNYFSCEAGDWTSLGNAVLQLNEQIIFKGLLDVGSIYTLGIGAKGFTRFCPLDWVDNEGGDATSTSDIRWGFLGTSLLFQNAIKIPNVLNINLNFEFMFVQWAGQWAWGRNSNGGLNHTDLDIFMTLALNGSYSFGFSWGLSQDFILGLNLENAVGNVPSESSGDGNDPRDNLNDVDEVLDGTIINNGGPQPAYFSNLPFLATTLNLSQDVLSLAGIKDVSLKISIDEKLLIECTYSGDMSEQTKLFNTQGKYGLTVGFYGFSVGLFATLSTQDAYNTDSPMNGYNGSDWVETTETVAGTPVIHDWSARNPGRGQAGCMITFGYSRGFFGFDFAWHGQGQIRDYDYEKDNFASALDKHSGLTVDNGGLYRQDILYYRWSNVLFCSINFSW